MPTDGCSSRPPIRRWKWTSLPRPKSFARLMTAADGRLWLLFRHHPLPGGLRETWAEYAMSFDGKAWSKPRMLADSDGILDNRPALAPCGADGVMAVYSSDWRLRGASNTVEPRPPAAEGRSLCHDPPRRRSDRVAPQLVDAVAGSTAIEPVHPHEPQDIQRLRECRVECRRQDLSPGPRRVPSPHRIHGPSRRRRFAGGHVALLPRTRPTWIGWATATTTTASATSTPGGSRRRPWTSTTTRPGSSPLTPTSAACEWPNGHRNVIFTQRGIRTLPRGDMNGDEKSGTPDTKMLYAYLQHFGGICASHTSATGMGTDWRDNDPLVEPVVEIYQGDRNNYECEGAPRGLTQRDMPRRPRRK